MVVQNPFSNRNMITNPNEFFGRKNELMTIFSRLENLQSCDVYGERKIGKSSLLYYIFMKAQDRLGADYVVAYIDMQAAEYHNVGDFLRNSLNELGANSKGIISSKSLNQNLIAFSESIKEMKKKKKPILLIDEFEVLTKKQEFNDDVFDALRSLGNNGHIAYVIASLNSLKTLCEKGKFTSPFYNIFSEVKLGKFTPEETTEFLSTISESFGFNEKEIGLIYEIANHHPIHLQIACDHVLKNKGKNLDEPKLREVIENEIKTYDDEAVRKKRHPEKLNGVKHNEGTFIDIQNKDEQLQTKKSFIDVITIAASIASLFYGIAVEYFEIYPTGWNKHLITLVGVAVIFFIALFLANKKV
ncbi:hypothetical protein METP3_02699 [Methanosarcinales archaeon]|nr:hypothetical protein METP3_02699 [Methanosarcinales archaeon]